MTLSATTTTSVAERRPRLARSSLFNLLGLGAPLFGALYAAPRLISGLGTERFGLLTLVWMLIGYFGLFDLGLSRALTQVVAEKIGENHTSRAPPLVWTALGAMLALGFIGAFAIALLAGWLVHSVLRIPPGLQSEALLSMYVLAAGTPFVVANAGLVGILTAFHRFGVLNAIRAPLGLYTFLSPLAVLPFSRSLVHVTSVLVLGRIFTFLAHVVACRGLLPHPRTAFREEDAGIGSLFRYGTWMTVSNLLVPLIQYADRFLIGAAVSVAAVAYYATPYEIVTKLLIVPGSILGVLFPAFAATAKGDSDRLLQLTTTGAKWVGLLLFPPLLLVVAFAEEGLQWWLGAEFARHGAAVLQWLAIGVFVNGLAQVFITLIHGVGRPDLSAKFHLLEVPIYLPLLWVGLGRYGILGAAVTRAVRMALDGCLLFLVSSRYTRAAKGPRLRMVAAILAAVACLLLPTLFDSLLLRGMLVVLLLIVLMPVAWYVVLGEGERLSIRGQLRWPIRAVGSRL